MFGFVPLASPFRLKAEQPSEHELHAWRILDLAAGRRPIDRSSRGVLSVFLWLRPRPTDRIPEKLGGSVIRTNS